MTRHPQSCADAANNALGAFYTGSLLQWKQPVFSVPRQINLGPRRIVNFYSQYFLLTRRFLLLLLLFEINPDFSLPIFWPDRTMQSQENYGMFSFLGRTERKKEELNSFCSSLTPPALNGCQDLKSEGSLTLGRGECHRAIWREEPIDKEWVKATQISLVKVLNCPSYSPWACKHWCTE